MFCMGVKFDPLYKGTEQNLIMAFANWLPKREFKAESRERITNM